MLQLWKQFWCCLLHGPDHMMTHFEPNRMYGRCLVCGRETNGWFIDSAR